MILHKQALIFHNIQQVYMKEIQALRGIKLQNIMKKKLYYGIPLFRHNYLNLNKLLGQLDVNIFFFAMIQKYTKIEKIAEGTFGVVYKGKDNINHQLVALKKFKKNKQNEGIPQNCLRQIQMLRTLEGRKQIIQIKDVILSRHGCVMIVYQFHQMSLKKFLKSNNTPYNIKNFMKQLVQGIKVLHDHNIIHRDLKPDNILLTKNMELRLADFGQARELPEQDQDMTNQISTLYYRAPQLLLGDTKYSKKVDIWALGCIFYELLKKTLLFQGNSELELITKILGIVSKMPHPLYLTKFDGYTSKIASNALLYQNLKKQLFENIPQKALDLLLKMLNPDPDSRIDINNILKHPFFNEKEE